MVIYIHFNAPKYKKYYKRCPPNFFFEKIYIFTLFNDTMKIIYPCYIESAKVEWTMKVGQVINLRGKKFVHRVLCVVLNSMCNINFNWIFFSL